MILCVHHFERGACQENTWPQDRIYCQVLVVIPHCRLITYYVVVIVKPDYFKYKPCKTGMGGYYPCITYNNYRGPYGGCRRQSSYKGAACILKPLRERASFWPLLVSKRAINWQFWLGYILTLLVPYIALFRQKYNLTILCQWDREIQKRGVASLPPSFRLSSSHTQPILPSRPHVRTLVHVRTLQLTPRVCQDRYPVLTNVLKDSILTLLVHI